MMNSDEQFLNKETFEKVSRMSMLLGMAWAAVTELSREKNESELHYKIQNLLTKLSTGIETIYYGRPEND